jgi:hypothetical protein
MKQQNREIREPDRMQERKTNRDAKTYDRLRNAVEIGWRILTREEVRERFKGYTRSVVCLYVEDSGPGMPKEVMENLFVPFTMTTCWAIKGRASMAETGKWNTECIKCPVYPASNLDHFYCRSISGG